MTLATSQDPTPQILLDNHIEPFLNHLRAAGYAERTLRKKRTVARAFARWAARKRITTVDLNDGHIAAFLARSPRRRKAHMKFERGAMQLSFRYLCSAAGVQGPPVQQDVSAAGGLLRRYEDYLRKDRGLAENSVLVYMPFIRDFLAAHSTDTGCVVQDAFGTLTIRDFILAQTAGRSEEYARLLATALRSFLRFLFLYGELPRDLSTSVPMVRRYRQTVPPAFLSPRK